MGVRLAGKNVVMKHSPMRAASRWPTIWSIQMTTWTYASGRLEARNTVGALLLTIPATPIWAFFADLLNVNRALSRLILAGYGYGEEPADLMG